MFIQDWPVHPPISAHASPSLENIFNRKFTLKKLMWEGLGILDHQLITTLCACLNSKFLRFKTKNQWMAAKYFVSIYMYTKLNG